MPGTRYQLEVNPEIPENLSRLQQLANNLWYSWDRPTRALFARLSPGLWRATQHSPKAFLKRIEQRRIDDAGEDPVFLGTLHRVLSTYDAYQTTTPLTQQKLGLGSNDLIAYFCAEFGFHESLPIYSGGLGILAGDHCKGASDLRLPFVAVGLLYRQGYFRQTIDRDGHQHAHYGDNDFADMPIDPVIAQDGGDVLVEVDFPGRSVWAKVWQAQVGNNRLFLLDTDIDKNSDEDRSIAHQLYGGDKKTRIEQEILLGVGGARTLHKLGLKPTVWHINEGHAAFLILERIRALMANNLTFDTALEAAAANTVFTTHTPVPAGHDHFDDEMMANYFAGFCQATGLNREQLLGLGRTTKGGGNDFNMTALALHGSRHHNGVSRIHGEVSSRICGDMWPEITPYENPMDYVTNAVHVPTFLATDWFETFDRHLGTGWQHRQTDQSCWNNVSRIPDQIFWSIRQSLKAQLLHLVHSRMRQQIIRNQGSEAHLDRTLRFADPTNPTVLTIGFARRFATYKRATLLFNNLDWLREILSNNEHPVLFIFAGKAHPADHPGQELIRQIAACSHQREFEGRILMLEGYDLHLARRLVAGVDVWLNNPIYPLEASGTSGIKAAINGAINLSVLDGWWGEGYNGKNGWGIVPAAEGLSPAERDAEEARTLYELLQDSVIPMYYRNTSLGYSPEWVAMSKQSIASIMPRFNMQRMLTEYTERFYAPASRQWRKYSEGNFVAARDIAEWKQRIHQLWPEVKLRRVDLAQQCIRYGVKLRFEVAVQLNGLAPDDLTVELVFTRPGEPATAKAKRYSLAPAQALADGEYLFARELTPEQCGKLEYRVRAFPSHELMTHPFEMGLTAWL